MSEYKYNASSPSHNLKKLKSFTKITIDLHHSILAWRQSDMMKRF